MADGTVSRSSRAHRSTCLPISEDSCRYAVDDPAAIRRLLDEGFRATPELFLPGFDRGYELKVDRTSAKRGLPIRLIRLGDGAAYSARPSFLTAYMTARVADVEGPLFLRTFGVPSGRWPASSAATRCTRIAWRSAWGLTASWGALSDGPSCQSTSWPMRITRRSTAGRSSSPRPSATAASSAPSPRRRPGPPS